MENNQNQFHPDIQKPQKSQNEDNRIFINEPVTNSNKSKKGAFGKKAISYLLVAILAAGGGFGGALAAVYFAPNILPPSIVKNDIAIKTSANINTAEAVAEKVMPSVVGISSTTAATPSQWQPQTLEDLLNPPERALDPYAQQQTALGTGIIFTEDGYILTNSHVILDGTATKVMVQLADSKEVEAKVLWSDAVTDLAVIKVEENNLIPAVLGDSEEVKVGSYAVAIGNPLGLAFERSVTQGVISGLSRTITVGTTQGGSLRMEGLIQTDASINGGNSGGPLCNSEGEVIGINTAKAQSGEGLGFAIPINIAKPIVEEIIKTGEFERSYMGITGDSVSDVLEKYPQVDLGIKYGVYVQQIYTDSPAAKAGIKEGDIVIAINDKEVQTMSQMIKDLFAYRPGDEIELTVIRDKAPKKISVVLDKIMPESGYSEN